MNENDKSDFKIGIDDEGPDRQFHEELENIRIEKLSNRITFISVLIPCLIAIIIFLAYLDIKKRVTTVHDTGTMEVQSLSKDLEAKLSSLSSQYKQLENSLPKIENNISSLQAEIKEATTAIRQIRSARKIDNKKFDTSIANLEKKITSSTNGLKNVSSEIKAFDSKFNKKLASLSNTADKISIELNNLKNNLKSDIVKLSSVTIDKKTLNSALKNEQKLYDQKLDQLKRNIEKKIFSIKALPKTAPSEDTTTESTVIEPGAIIEQDINQ
jgi:chromosome segregation ATPase